jgi:hypothetical protein
MECQSKTDKLQFLLGKKHLKLFGGSQRMKTPKQANLWQGNPPHFNSYPVA